LGSDCAGAGSKGGGKELRRVNASAVGPNARMWRITAVTYLNSVGIEFVREEHRKHVLTLKGSYGMP
jgi:hypothetical protein